MLEVPEDPRLVPGGLLPGNLRFKLSAGHGVALEGSGIIVPEGPSTPTTEVLITSLV